MNDLLSIQLQINFALSAQCVACLMLAIILSAVRDPSTAHTCETERYGIECRVVGVEGAEAHTNDKTEKQL